MMGIGGSQSLQQYEPALLGNPTSLLELKQDSGQYSTFLRDTEGLWGAPLFHSHPQEATPPQDRGELYSFKLATVVVITLPVTSAIIC